MNPISAGSGPESYTLYFPYAFSERRGVIDINSGLADLALKIGHRIDIIERSSSFRILRVYDHASYNEAEQTFYVLKRFYDRLILETGTPIFAYDVIEIQQERPPASSIFAKWRTEDIPSWGLRPGETELVVDAIVNILFPCIVAEHLRILDAGVVLGKATPKPCQDAITETIDSLSLHNASGNQRHVDLALV